MHLKNLTGLVSLTLFMIIMNVVPTVTADPTVMVTDYTIEPETLMPGDTAELMVTVTNTETTATHTDTDYINGQIVDQTVGTIAATINEISITADGDNSYLVKALKSYEDLGDLSPGSSVILSIPLRADTRISEGLYYPVINIDVNEYQDAAYPFPVRVDNQTVTLLSNDVPSKISIGGSTDITFTIVNQRKNTVDSITITAGEQNDLSFTPNNNYIRSLDAGSSEDISISVHPTEMGEQILSLNLSFMNGDNPHYETHDLSIEVIEVLDVAPIFTNLPVSIKKGGSSRIGLEVYNAKTESITGVIITPLIDTTVIPSQYFIGAMDPDDVFSASFDLYTDMLDYGNHTIKFQVSYKQGNEYFETPSISHTFQVISGQGVSYQTSSNGNTDSTPEFGGDIMTSCLTIIGVIIIIIVIIILWRWKKGRKNQ